MIHFVYQGLKAALKAGQMRMERSPASAFIKRFLCYAFSKSCKQMLGDRSGEIFYGGIKARFFLERRLDLGRLEIVKDAVFRKGRVPHIEQMRKPHSKRLITTVRT